MFTSYIDDSIKDKKISTNYTKQVVSDIELKPSINNPEKINVTIGLGKLNLVGGIIIIGICIMVIRIIFLQVIKGNEYRTIAEGNRIRIEYLPADRGIIYDRNSTALVKNIPNFLVVINPSNLPHNAEEKENVLNETATLLNIPLDTLKHQLDEHTKTLYSQPLVLQEFVPYDKALTFSTQLHHMPGVDVEVQASREYTDAEIFSHILGYLGKVTVEDINEDDFSTNPTYLLSDVLGKSGLEDYYEEQLRGNKGRKQIEVNAAGTEIEEIAKEDPQAGNNAVLAIDAELQRTLYAQLDKVSNEVGSPGGAAVALDPKTGKVLALVSFPGYDTNLFTHGIDSEVYQGLLNDERKPLFNKAVMGEYPSGSTFKLIVAAAALQEGVVTPETTFNSIGYVQVNASKFKDYKAGGHGVTDIRKALAESVNTYFYYAGGGQYMPETNTIEGGLGIDRINHYAKLFGLSSALGIDLPSEAAGFVPAKEWKEETYGESWYIGDTYNTSIGQGYVLVTPLQVAAYTAAVANGGTTYAPELLQYTHNSESGVQEYVEPKIINTNIIDSSHLQVVREGMRQAVTDGSSRRLGNLPVEVAAKTGTSQIAGTESTHSWITTFAPYNDPQIVLTVLVEKGGEGSQTALTVAQEGLKTFFAPEEAEVDSE